MPATWTGLVVADSVPFPSWPSAFAPQERTWPVVRSAQKLAPPPAAICATLLERLLTLRAVGRLVSVPSPSSPLVLRPQQRTLPRTSAHVDSAPSARPVA